MYSYNRYKGIGLLETLLALGIIAIIFMFSFSRYQLYNHERKVAITRNSVDMMLEALTRYYYANCSGRLEFRPFTAKELNKMGFLPGEKLETPLAHRNIQGRIIQQKNSDEKTRDLIPNVYFMQAELTFSKEQEAAFYKNPLNATHQAGAILTWDKLPRQNMRITKYASQSTPWLSSNRMLSYRREKMKILRLASEKEGIIRCPD